MDLARVGRAGRSSAVATLVLFGVTSLASIALLRVLRGGDFALAMKVMYGLSFLDLVPGVFLAVFAYGLRDRASTPARAYAGIAVILLAPVVSLVDGVAEQPAAGLGLAVLRGLVGLWASAAAYQGQRAGLWGREATIAGAFAAAGGVLGVIAAGMSFASQAGPSMALAVTLTAVGGWLGLGVPVFAWIGGTSLLRVAAAREALGETPG